MHRHHLLTFDDVVKGCGGIKRVARLADRSVQAVYEWRKTEQIPARFYFDIVDELERRGQPLPAREVFSFHIKGETWRTKADAA
ncbi:MAG TPA: hypothetical protein VKB34_11775 [Povalibacter sp.]|nr:hypothetical protein [Povalibacter sp.]